MQALESPLKTASKVAGKGQKSKNVVKTVWDEVRGWPRLNTETCVLMDPEVASRVAEVINETSEAGPDTPFIDGDGGFLRVPQNIFCKQRTTCGDPTHFRKFKHWKVFARNTVLDEIVNQARETYLSQNPYADHIQSHLHSYTAKYYADHFESDLYKEVTAASKTGQSVSWEDARANLTVYATVPLGFIRYLTKRYVEKDSPTLNQFNELKYGRPEFYFFVTRKTFAAINMSKKSLQRSFPNILFNCLFDHESLLTVDRKVFAPWPPKIDLLDEAAVQFLVEKSQRSTNGVLPEIYMHLVRIRPKAHTAIKPSADPEFDQTRLLKHFQKFLDELMVNHSKYLAPLVRTWNPNVLDQVIELVGKGRTVKTLTMEDKISVFNMLTSDKNYSSCSFANLAESFTVDKMRQDPSDPDLIIGDEPTDSTLFQQKMIELRKSVRRTD